MDTTMPKTTADSSENAVHTVDAVIADQLLRFQLQRAEAAQHTEPEADEDEVSRPDEGGGDDCKAMNDFLACSLLIACS
jgi:hypothetical protein